MPSVPMSSLLTRRLLGPDDPPPVSVFNETGRAGLLLLCDHADRAVPRRLGRLGLDEAAFELHIAWDIGAAGVTRLLASRFDAPAVMSAYSRLVVDLNRSLDDPTLMPEISDGVVIPANHDMAPEEQEARLREIYDPYHAEVARRIDAFLAAGRVPAIISIHSFTPVMRGFERPWHVGVLWDRDPRLPVPLIEELRKDLSLVVGDNEPYTGRGVQGTVDQHAAPKGLPHVLVELRQDLIATPDGQEEWATRLGDALEGILDDPTLFHIEKF